jgi:lipopolysaccharide transport system ATP-binding protein
MSAVVTVEGVGKLFHHHSRSASRTLMAVARDELERRRTGEDFWALRDVTFDVSKGSAVGIVGANGAGKSTLLRLIGGVGKPDEGSITVRGRIGAIFELGANFHQELTGRENTALAGIVAGLTKRQVRARMDEIFGFAELEEFADDPIRTYSSGMVGRLAFAIATSIDPDVLLVDEFLAVGDLSFQRRCNERLNEFARAGTTMLLVSHAPSMLARICDEVIWLRAGRVVARGSPQEVTQRYEMAMAEAAARVTPHDTPESFTHDGVPLRVHENRFGTQEGQITSVRLVDTDGTPVRQIQSGDGVVVEVRAQLPAEFRDVHLGVRLVRSDGVRCIDSGTELRARRGQSCRSARLEIGRLDLLGGDYAFEIGLYSDNWEKTLDFHWRAYPLRIVGALGDTAVLDPPTSWLQDD